MEFVTFAYEEGFNIIDCEDEQAAEMLTGQESICLGPVEVVDEDIVRIIRQKLDMDAEISPKTKQMIDSFLLAHPEIPQDERELVMERL